MENQKVSKAQNFTKVFPVVQPIVDEKTIKNRHG